MEGFDESVADVAGAGFVASGDTEVCAIAALDRTAARNAAVKQKPVRDMSVSLIFDLETRMAVLKKRAVIQLNKFHPQNFALICVKNRKARSRRVHLALDKETEPVGISRRTMHRREPLLYSINSSVRAVRDGGTSRPETEASKTLQRFDDDVQDAC
jgi:hypothetical protein